MNTSLTAREKIDDELQHDCEFFLTSDVTVYSCKCEHITVSDKSISIEYVPLKKYQVLQSQLSSITTELEQLRKVRDEYDHMRLSASNGLEAMARLNEQLQEELKHLKMEIEYQKGKKQTILDLAKGMRRWYKKELEQKRKEVEYLKGE